MTNVLKIRIRSILSNSLRDVQNAEIEASITDDLFYHNQKVLTVSVCYQNRTYCQKMSFSSEIMDVPYLQLIEQICKEIVCLIKLDNPSLIRTDSIPLRRLEMPTYNITRSLADLLRTETFTFFASFETTRLFTPGQFRSNFQRKNMKPKIENKVDWKKFGF